MGSYPGREAGLLDERASSRAWNRTTYKGLMKPSENHQPLLFIPGFEGFYHFNGRVFARETKPSVVD